MVQSLNCVYEEEVPTAELQQHLEETVSERKLLKEEEGIIERASMSLGRSFGLLSMRPPMLTLIMLAIYMPHVQ